MTLSAGLIMGSLLLLISHDAMKVIVVRTEISARIEALPGFLFI